MISRAVRVLLISAALALLIVAARAIGSAQPAPEALQALHLNDCQLPCWSGITPGKTTFDEAIQRMQAAYPQSIPSVSGAQASIEFQFASSRLAIDIFADKVGIVQDMLLYTYGLNRLTIGDVVSLLDAPIQVFGSLPLIAIPICPSSLVGLSGSTTGEGWQRPLTVLEIQNTDVSDLCR